MVVVHKKNFNQNLAFLDWKREEIFCTNAQKGQNGSSDFFFFELCLIKVKIKSAEKSRKTRSSGGAATSDLLALKQ